MPSFHDACYENSLSSKVDFTVRIFCAKISLVNIPLLPTFLPKLPAKAWKETRRFEKIRKSPLIFKKQKWRKYKDLRRNPVLLRRFIRWLKSYLFAMALPELAPKCPLKPHKTTIFRILLQIYYIFEFRYDETKSKAVPRRHRFRLFRDCFLFVCQERPKPSPCTDSKVLR